MTAYDFDRKLKLPDGKTDMPMSADDETPATCALPVMNALLREMPGDKTTEGLAYRLYALQQKISDGGVVELEATDVTLIIDRVLYSQPPHVYGQVCDLLNGRDAPVDRPLEKAPPSPATFQGAAQGPGHGPF